MPQGRRVAEATRRRRKRRGEGRRVAMLMCGEQKGRRRRRKRGGEGRKEEAE